jgi:LmbE family N-acetylglucosaminyl deacetylase
VLTFGADGMTFHPDHQAVHRWVHHVWEEWGRSARLLHAVWTDRQLDLMGDTHDEHGIFMTDSRPAPVAEDDLRVHLTLSGAALDRKVVALRAMATQTGPLLAAAGEERFAALAAEEAFVDALAAELEPMSRPTGELTRVGA